MVSIIYLFFYSLLLFAAYEGLIWVKVSPFNPNSQILLILGVIVLVLFLQSIFFSLIYRNVYSSSLDIAFSGSEIYKSRKQEEAVKELWLSKDVKSSFFFPNWGLLEITDNLNDEGRKTLNQFYKAYEIYYGAKLDYNLLRHKLSKDFPELLLQSFSPNSPKKDNVVKDFITKLSSRLSSLGVTLDVHNQSLPLNKNIDLRLSTILNELSEQIPVNRFDVLLSIKSNEILDFIKQDFSSLLGKDKEALHSIEKSLFYYLAKRLLINTQAIPVKLAFGDFFYYSTLSFLSANNGDIQPKSTYARICTFIQVLGTFVILALAISYLSNPIGLIQGLSLTSIKMFGISAAIITIIILICVFVSKLIQNHFFNKNNRQLLEAPENYGYSPKLDGTVDLTINVNKPSESQSLSKHFKLSMPYTAVLGSDVRFPGILVTAKTSKIVWAEIFPPTVDGLYVYGDNYNINKLDERFKIFIPGTFTAFESN
ncbi:MAG: ion channel [Pseudomonadota bacterium]